MIFELLIKGTREDKYIEFSKYYEGGPLYRFCSWTTDILIFPHQMTENEKTSFDRIFSNTLKDSKILNEEDINFVVKKCVHKFERSLVVAIQKKGGLVSYPIKVEKGYEFLQITCIDNLVMKNVLNVLNNKTKYQVLSISELGIDGLLRLQQLDIQDLLSDITDKQLKVLISANELGYYNIPRKIYAKDLARKFKISEYGLQKLLRQAENRIMKKLRYYFYFKYNLTQQ
ncbi:MAG: hypothetical protein HeimC2_35580 [Candidatus Heimdallarchaeota archaeon LC_2]|nr:MAG: hypothetical protein HeimC2_35580 [Candidatus Heimdallarchaeota archaeon LC_2]